MTVERGPLTWHEEVMGVCPHGCAARAYCATCVAEDREAERKEREFQEQEKRVEVLRKQLWGAGIRPKA